MMSFRHVNLLVVTLSIFGVLIFHAQKQIAMKRFLLFVATLAIVGCANRPHFHENQVIAHRGAWKNTGHPQNSLASFRAAAEMGCHGSE